MTKINLTEEEKAKFIKLINDGSEIPLELLQKLGPGFFDKLAQEGKFDFATLEKFKVPTLEYAGKRAENVILASASLTGGNAPLQVERCFESGNITNGKSQLTIFEESRNEHNNWRNLIIQGDNLQFLKTCYLNKDPLIKDKVKGKVKLIYIDPPFATKSDFGGKVGEDSYTDRVDRSEFTESLRERLIYLRELLDKSGNIYVHMGIQIHHMVRCILDEVFDSNNFVSEIIWAYGSASGGRAAGTKVVKIHEYLLHYAKSYSNRVENKLFTPYSEKYIKDWFKYIDNGRRYQRRQRGRDQEGNSIWEKQYLDESPGVPLTTVWNDIRQIYADPRAYKENQASHTEITGYPTQKPEKLLERIILASSNPEDLVMDCFAGSGTTGAVAEKLGRKWIMCDFGKHSIYVMQKRILRIGESKKLGQNAGKNAKYGHGPKPFYVASCGGYDFTRIMNLRESKDAYIAFVLGLFNLSRTEEDYLKKYKLPNIYGEKENNPVEIYPVWEDEYLKNIKIDKDYLQGIVDQSGGKLKGDYYIITPVSFTKIIGDTTLENAKKEPVHFKILSFPYKILEEASRSFEIKEQPSSSKNINDLITSVGFYFNEQVEVFAKQTTDGIHITKFKSEITDGSGNKYEGMAGLAMVLVDKDYNGKVFDMEEAVYAVDIKDDGKITIGGITADTHIIAIDKHGNESKITPVK